MPGLVHSVAVIPYAEDAVLGEAARYRPAGRTRLVSGLAGLSYPFPLAIRTPAGRGEATASVQPLRALVVWMCQQVNPRLIPPLRLGENSVQYGSSDSPAPPPGINVQKAEEASAGDDRACPALLAQGAGGGHRDRLWSLGRHEKPRARVTQACPNVIYPGGLAGPGALTAGQVRPLVDRDCGVDVSSFAKPDQDHALKRTASMHQPWPATGLRSRSHAHQITAFRDP